MRIQIIGQGSKNLWRVHIWDHKTFLLIAFILYDSPFCEYCPCTLVSSLFFRYIIFLWSDAYVCSATILKTPKYKFVIAFCGNSKGNTRLNKKITREMLISEILV